MKVLCCVYCLFKFLTLGLGLGCQGAGLLEEELSLFAQELAAAFFFFSHALPLGQSSILVTVYTIVKSEIRFRFLHASRICRGAPDEQACKKWIRLFFFFFFIVAFIVLA